MKAEIVSTGTEILLGQTLNTNAHYLTGKLSGLGIEVDYHTTVGDNPQRLEEVLRQALKRSELVIVTGGTGTTADDLTKRIAAKIMGVELVLDEESLGRIERFFAARNKVLTDDDRQLACVPKGAKTLPNRQGTAPGIIAKIQYKYLVILPGPPKEMEPMFEAEVWPWLKTMVDDCRERMHVRVLKVFGLHEKELEQRLGSLMQTTNPAITLLSKHTEMHVRLIARSAESGEAERMLEELEKDIRRRLGSLVYGKNEDTLVNVVMSMLKMRGLTLSTAESCTGGLLGGTLTQIPGSSAVFWGGIIGYDNSVKARVLGVDSHLIEKVGAVSPEVAEAMAKGVRQLIGTDLGIGITGIAGPGGGSNEKPVGLVYIALAAADRVQVKKFQFVGERETVRQLAVQHALNMIREHLLESERG